MKCFDSPFPRSARTLQTPYLISPGRTESHRKEISPDKLAKFRGEIQASSVVSHARQTFQQLLAKIDRKQMEPTVHQAQSPKMMQKLSLTLAKPCLNATSRTMATLMQSMQSSWKTS